MTTTRPHSISRMHNKTTHLEQWVHEMHRQIAEMQPMVFPQEKKGIWDSISWMLRNKFGLTKDAAKKMFYDYRSKDQPEEPDQNPDQNPPETVEEKMNVIMGYMKETSSKLDHIENDIRFLKEQVEQILNKL